MRNQKSARAMASGWIVALFMSLHWASEAQAQDDMDDLSANVEDMPELSANIPGDLGDKKLPVAPNRWDLRSGVMSNAQTEMRSIEAKLAQQQSHATRLESQYFQLTQQYQTLRVKYAALEQQYAGGMQQLQQLQQMGNMLQMQGQQVMQALQQAQAACNYGNQQACWQAQQYGSQYQALVVKYQQLEQQYNYISSQLREIAAAGHQLQLAGASIERTATDVVQAYQQQAVVAQQAVDRYQQLKVQVASAVADADSPGLDYNSIATQLKNNGGLSTVSLDKLAKGVKAGVGAGFIAKDEVAKLKANGIQQTIADVATLANKTTQILRDVGLIK